VGNDKGIEPGASAHSQLHKFRLSGTPPRAGSGLFNPGPRARQRKTEVEIEQPTTNDVAIIMLRSGKPHLTSVSARVLATSRILLSSRLPK
jgi:hypothetical protein